MNVTNDVFWCLLAERGLWSRQWSDEFANHRLRAVQNVDLGYTICFALLQETDSLLYGDTKRWSKGAHDNTISLLVRLPLLGCCKNDTSPSTASNWKKVGFSFAAKHGSKFNSFTLRIPLTRWLVGIIMLGLAEDLRNI